MLKQIFFSFIFFYIISSHLIYSQVGIGTKTPNSSSMLDIESTDKGILIPRMTENQKISVLSPVSGLLIYQIDKEIGFYFYDGSIWLRIVKNISPNFTGTINSGAIISMGTISATAFLGDGSGLTGTGGLQSITENGITGYRRADAAPANYGNIGSGAVDLSLSTSSSLTSGASGRYSTAMGNGTIASGERSTAMGGFNDAIGNYSTAMGLSTTANGDGSTAMGNNTTASGSNSTAMGEITIASGSNSTAMGYKSTASDYGSVVIGRYNSAGSSVSTGGSATAFDQDNTAFVIGNGNSSSEKGDAFKVMFNGNVTATGSITAVSFPSSSDRRLKENIKGTKYGLDEVLKLEPVDYNFKSNGLEQIGFIAQDVRSLIPEVVTGKEGDIQKGETLGIEAHEIFIDTHLKNFTHQGNF